MTKTILSRESLQRLVMREAAGEWGCEDMTGVAIEKSDPPVDGRNWTVTRLENEDLPAAMHTVAAIVARLGQQYDLEED
jgi:hypothetical protein